MEQQPYDRISLLGMVFFGYHGAYAAERELGQRFEVDLELDYDCRRAVASDDLSDAVNYELVYSQVKSVVEGSPVNLLETLAERIAREVLTLAGVRSVRVRVRKPQAPLAGVLGTVQVEVTRRPTGDGTNGNAAGGGHGC